MTKRRESSPNLYLEKGIKEHSFIFQSTELEK